MQFNKQFSSVTNFHTSTSDDSNIFSCRYLKPVVLKLQNENHKYVSFSRRLKTCSSNPNLTQSGSPAQPGKYISNHNSKDNDKQQQYIAFNQFLAKSFLFNQHEYLMKRLKLPKDIVNRLNINFFATSSKYKMSKKSVLEEDPALAYLIFSCLHQLDQTVLKKLLEENGPDSQPQFELDYLIQSIQLLNEPIQVMLRKVSPIDQPLAIAVESFWKYLVFLLDNLIVYIQGKCQSYVDAEISKFRSSYKQLQQQNISLQEQIFVKMKELVTQQNVEEMKRKKIMEDNFELQRDLEELKSKLSDFGNLELAEERMKGLGFQSIQMADHLKQWEKQSSHQFHSNSRTFKSIVQVLIKRKEDSVPQYQLISQQMKFPIIQLNHVFCYSQIAHPFTVLYLEQFKIKNQMINFSQQLDNYYFGLQLQLGDLLNKAQNVSEHFLQEFKERAIPIINWLYENESGDYSNINICMRKFFCILFGIQNEEPLDFNGLRELVEISKYIRVFENKPSIQGIHRRANIFPGIDDGVVRLTSDLKYNHQDADHLKKLEEFVPPDMFHIIKSHLEDISGEGVTFCRLLLFIAIVIRDKSKNEWNEFKNGLKQMTMFGNWSELKEPHFIDKWKLKSYMIHKYSVESKSPEFRTEELFIDESLKEVRQIYLVNPRIFWKFELLVESGTYFYERLKFRKQSRKSMITQKKHRTTERIDKKRK